MHSVVIFLPSPPRILPSYQLSRGVERNLTKIPVDPFPISVSDVNPRRFLPMTICYNCRSVDLYGQWDAFVGLTDACFYEFKMHVFWRLLSILFSPALFLFSMFPSTSSSFPVIAKIFQLLLIRFTVFSALLVEIYVSIENSMSGVGTNDLFYTRAPIVWYRTIFRSYFRRPAVLLPPYIRTRCNTLTHAYRAKRCFSTS